MSDKISRLIQLIEKGKGEVSDESFDDTLEDLAAYGLLYRARPKEESQDAGHSADSPLPADCQGPGHRRF
jgi:hypothetical protein